MRGYSETDFTTALRRALHHRIPETAAMAAAILAERGCDDAIPELIELSLSKDPMRAEAGLEALGAFLLDERARWRLREARLDGTIRERRIAAHILEADTS